MKALYAALALFFVAAPTASSARSPDLSLSPPLCSDDYYEDTAGQCGAVSAGEVLTIEAILAKYGVIVVDGEVIVLYFDELDDMPVGSIQPRNEDAGPTNEKFNIEPAEQETIVSRVVTPDAQSEIAVEAVDDITTTGPAARRIPAAIGLLTTIGRSSLTRSRQALRPLDPETMRSPFDRYGFGAPRAGVMLDVRLPLVEPSW